METRLSTIMRKPSKERPGNSDVCVPEHFGGVSRTSAWRAVEGWLQKNTIKPLLVQRNSKMIKKLCKQISAYQDMIKQQLKHSLRQLLKQHLTHTQSIYKESPLCRLCELEFETSEFLRCETSIDDSRRYNLIGITEACHR